MSFVKNINGGSSLINDKYIIKKKIGQGAFGEIFKGKNLQKNSLVAIKFEKHNNSNFFSESESDNFEKLKNTSNLVNETIILSHFQKERGFPRLYSYGYEKNQIYMIISYLGENLEKKLKKCSGFFSLQTICKIAIQSIDLLSKFHEKGFIHRDIKPENLMVGRGAEKEMIYLIDFGLSIQYINHNNEHNKFQLKRGFVGTARYASINAHKGYGQSRRDDLISLGYCLIYFMKGFLQWQDVKIHNKTEKFAKIREIKEKSGYDELTKGLNPCFQNYLQNVFELGFFDKPDYNYLKKIFVEALIGEHIDFIQFDWNLLKINKKEAKISKKMKNLLRGVQVDFSKLKEIQEQEESMLLNQSLILLDDEILENNKENNSFTKKSNKQNSNEISKILNLINILYKCNRKNSFL